MRLARNALAIAVTAAALLVPLAARAAPAEREAAAELMDTVERLAGAWTNRGRMGAVRERVGELGLSPYLQTEWIDWFTLYDNVMIEVPGSGDQIVYVVAHWDKVDVTPIAVASLLLNGMLDEIVSWTFTSDGALDDGTGVALALSLARHFASRENRYTYRFLFTGSEEMGLRGSRAHMARLSQDEAGRIAFVVNLDTLARAGSTDCALTDIGDPLLTARLLHAARDSEHPVGETRIPEAASSDHAPFARTSFWHDFGRGLLFNMPGGVLPQRSWFTSSKSARVVMMSDCDVIDWSDYVGGFFFLPIGTIHGPRDDFKKVDGAALLRAFRVLRIFLERMDADPS